MTVMLVMLLGIPIVSAVADPFPRRPPATNTEVIIRSGVANSTLIIAGKITDLGLIANSQAASDAEVLRVFKAPPEFQSKKISIGYLIGKYDPELTYFKEKPHTNTFLLFLKDWGDVTGPNDPFVEATEQNVRLLQAELKPHDPTSPSRAPRRNVIIAVSGFMIAGLVTAGVLWLNRRRSLK